MADNGRMVDIMKKAFIEKIKNLFGVELVDEPISKPKRSFIRCKITDRAILAYLAMNNIRCEQHRNDYYFVYVK